MPSRTLLERLYEPQSSSSRGSQDEELELWRSIQQNLSNILNSGKGHSCSAADYGMDDLTSQLREKYSPQTVIEMIRSTIEKYEPRLSLITVTAAATENLGKLAFRIQAVMIAEDGEYASTFHTTLEGNGAMNVSSR